MNLLSFGFSFLVIIMFLGMIITIRFIKIKIEQIIKQGKTENTFEEFSLFSSFNTKNYREELVLLFFGIITYLFSRFYNELYFINIILILTFFYFALYIIQAMFFNNLYSQPYFEDEKLYQTANDSIFNKELEDKLKKYKLLGKENSITKKAVLLDFIKEKISNTSLKKIIIFVYFYLVSAVQILLLIFGIIFWILKVKGKI